MKKILIANRGEIAVRIIRTAQTLGYAAVAVFSAADAHAPHVAMADQAVFLGPAEVDQSYLNIQRVLAAARRSGADAIHPGYGFLSENADFARQVIDAGLIWIGPPPDAMKIMGNKAAAKLALADTDVPVIPGYGGEDQADAAFIQAAESIGYPVMVKAAAGGGGRGMRLVKQPESLLAALTSARSEALKAFGSDELLLEKAIVNPRHIEVQIFGDQHGNIIHLGERDCSIQRRHQKVVEEAPSPAVSPALRARIGQAAVAAAQAVGYHGAGTVEFLLDEAGQFYFIEMNTRLQVEHPVTEMITGLDLVAWQFLVAEGDPLPLTQRDVRFQGHAIEVRLYAEDPENQFLPSIGQVHLWQPPADHEGVRVDHGLTSGMEITPYYDAMVAKIMAWGETRTIACRRLQRALSQTAILGVATNRCFLLACVTHPIFAAGETTTSFIEKTWQPNPMPPSAQMEALAAALLYEHNCQSANHDLRGWGGRTTTYCFDPEDRQQVIQVETTEAGLRVINREHQFDIQILSCEENQLTYELDGLRDRAWFALDAEQRLWLQMSEEMAVFADVLLAPVEEAERQSDGRIFAPMPGAVLRVDVAEGDVVTKGQSLVVLEAMKMEHGIVSPLDGTVQQLLVVPGQQMQPRELMAVIDF